MSQEIIESEQLQNDADRALADFSITVVFPCFREALAVAVWRREVQDCSERVRRLEEERDRAEAGPRRDVFDAMVTDSGISCRLARHELQKALAAYDRCRREAFGG